MDGPVNEPKVYWIEAFGVHWRYGVKVDTEEDVQVLSNWHHNMHDQDALDRFAALKDLVTALWFVLRSSPDSNLVLTHTVPWHNRSM